MTLGAMACSHGAISRISSSLPPASVRASVRRMDARISMISLVSLALLTGCGDSAAGTDGQTGASSSTGPATTGSTQPTSSSTGETTTSTSGASESASSAPTTDDPPDPTTTTTTTTTGDPTTGGPVEPGGCVESVDGWCWVYPLPHGNSLHDIWPDGAGRVWVAGEGNTLMWHDGQGWHTRSASAIEGLRGVWGAAPDDVWAVGDGGLILHFDGDEWTEVESPATETLRAVWGSGPSDVYAGGDGGALFHFDGVAWAPYDPGLVISDVLAIWGLGPDDVWVTSHGFGGVTIHWDGVAWSYRPVDEQGSATAVWGRGPDDVYVTLDQTVVLSHWTGDPIWDDLEYPGAQPMYAVAGNDTELWAGGRNMLLHHDGAAWSEVEELAYAHLQSLERVGDDMLAVGQGGVIGRMHDGAWAVEAGDRGTFGTTIGSVRGYSADDVWFSGWDLRHWDGESMTVVDLGVPNLQMGSFAGADGELWAIGVAVDKRAVWHHDGGLEWSEVQPLPYASGGTPLWAADATTLWIAGDFNEGDIIRWDGQKMDFFEIPGATFAVNQFHGLAPDDLWAVGNYERLLHWDGVEWTIVHSVADGDYLQGVWELAPDDVWTAGANGKVYHWDGASWTAQKLNNWGFNDLWATAADDIWAVGGMQASHGVIFHYDGDAWTEVVSGSGEPLLSLWGADGTVWAVGYGNSVLVHRP
jgi:hypothetical protein